MATVAFVVLAFMLAMYVLLDGYDLGAATIAPIVARSSDERGAILEAIQPFKDGNEVWLIAAGGALFALFPRAYAAAFSGFYLPFMVVLWLLMFRGIAAELRNHFSSEIWRDFWDFCFTASSALLALLFGVALGNILRGLPLNADGYFEGTFAFLLNPYALLVGLTAVAALALHGALFLNARSQPPARLRATLPVLIAITAALYVATTIASIGLRPHIIGVLTIVLPIISIAALMRIWISTRSARGRDAFAASIVFLASLVGAAAVTIYPFLLPPIGAARGISVFDAAPSAAALITAVVAVVAGLILIGVYLPITVRALTSSAQHFNRLS